jgi:hypothetical protein
MRVGTMAQELADSGAEKRWQLLLVTWEELWGTRRGRAPWGHHTRPHFSGPELRFQGLELVGMQVTGWDKPSSQSKGWPVPSSECSFHL